MKLSSKPFSTKKARTLYALGGVGSLLVLGVNAAPAQEEAKTGKIAHLEIARQLVRDLQQDALINTYGSNPTFLRWGTPTREARTVCATFVTRVFERVYHWKKEDMQNWLGANGADASDWYTVIVHENGFRRLRSIRDLRPGDILAIKYNDDSKDTGHVVIVDAEPQRRAATPPLEPGTEQYGLEVIDSSASGHGPADTRHKADGSFTGGIGKGTFRLYTDREGRIVGYAWSETKKSKFYHSPARELAAGRLTREVRAGEAEQDSSPH